MGTLERGERLGWVRTCPEIPRMGCSAVRDSRHRHKSCRRKWVVELVDSFERRRRECRGRFRPTLRSVATGRWNTGRQAEKLSDATPGCPRNACRRKLDRGRRALAQGPGVL